MNRAQLTGLLLLFFGYFLVSCQKEEMEIIDNTPGDSITIESSLAKLLLDTSMNNGSIDDFIDGTPCSSIQMPFEVIVNGQTITINNQAQLEALAQISSPITIVFPVIVVFEDFSTILVNNQQELDALAQSCQAFNDAIDCVELVYPVTFFVYNANNEQTGTVVINNNAELFSFITNLEAGVYVALQFPVTVILADGSQVSVTSHTQLQAIIENCEDSVTNPHNPADLEHLLTSGKWFITLFFDNEDETYLFADYNFTFNSNGSATASSGSNTVNGSWYISSSSSGLKLSLDFGDDNPFDELEEDWKVLDFNNNQIRLRDGSDLLTFSRTPYSGGNGNVQLLNDILLDGLWYVALYLEDGDEDYTSIFNSFQFDFQSNGVVTVSNNVVTLNGNWFVTTGNGDNLKLILSFSDVYPLDEIDEDWFVVEFQNNQFKLIDDDDDDDPDELVFQKL